MITTEYIGFLESLSTSIVGISIVFLCLVFLAIFVLIVSRVIEVLEKSLSSKTETVANTVKAAETPKKDNKESMKKIAVITAAISEERKEPVDRFVITNIQKI